MRERCFESAPALAGCTFEADDQKNTKVSAACERYANTFERGDPYGLLLFGEVGGGKTYMAAAVANRLIERGFSVLHTDIGSVATLMESSFEKRQRNLERILSYDLLIIDDLGAQRSTEYMMQHVYAAVSYTHLLQSLSSFVRVGSAFIFCFLSLASSVFRIPGTKNQAMRAAR